MTVLDIYELGNIEASRIEREAWELPAETRARFAGHALSVNRPDVAAEFISDTHSGCLLVAAYTGAIL